MRQIVFDTETTGIDISAGNRVLEIGCVEIIDREITGKTWHTYINPERDSEPDALEIHGITSEFLADKPLFSDIVADFIEFIKGAELIAHNASFDINHLNNELKLDGGRFGRIEDYCQVTDSLAMARSKYPGTRVTLDALCRRFDVDNSGRDLHGALIDANLLAQVYLLMTGGQKGLEFGDANDGMGGRLAEKIQQINKNLILPVLTISPQEQQAHDEYMLLLSKKSGKECIW